MESEPLSRLKLSKSVENEIISQLDPVLLSITSEHYSEIPDEQLIINFVLLLSSAYFQVSLLLQSMDYNLQSPWP